MQATDSTNDRTLKAAAGTHRLFASSLRLWVGQFPLDEDGHDGFSPKGKVSRWVGKAPWSSFRYIYAHGKEVRYD